MGRISKVFLPPSSNSTLLTCTKPAAWLDIRIGMSSGFAHKIYTFSNTTSEIISVLDYHKVEEAAQEAEHEEDRTNPHVTDMLTCMH